MHNLWIIYINYSDAIGMGVRNWGNFLKATNWALWLLTKNLPVIFQVWQQASTKAVPVMSYTGMLPSPHRTWGIAHALPPMKRIAGKAWDPLDIYALHIFRFLTPASSFPNRFIWRLGAKVFFRVLFWGLLLGVWRGQESMKILFSILTQHLYLSLLPLPQPQGA